MTKQDYELIANAIAATAESARFTGDCAVAIDTLAMLAVRLADDLADDNPRFDASRFKAACELSA